MRVDAAPADDVAAGRRERHAAAAREQRRRPAGSTRGSGRRAPGSSGRARTVRAWMRSVLRPVHSAVGAEVERTQLDQRLDVADPRDVVERRPAGRSAASPR